MGLGSMLNCCDVNPKQIFDADLMFKSLALNNCAFFFKRKFNELIWHCINSGVMMLIRTVQKYYTSALFAGEEI